MDYQLILDNIYDQILQFANEGKQADYIPALAKVNPDHFGMCLNTVNGESYSIQDSGIRFSIQSISKVFALALALSIKGEDIWKQVGKEPSGTAFNSLFQLELEKGIPRNPFINSGAMVVTDILMNELKDPGNDFIDFVRALCGNDTIDYNMEVALSERQNGYMNAAIANLLKYHGRLTNNIEEVLMFYFKMCSIEMSCEELATAFLAFTGYKPFNYKGFHLTNSQVKRLNAVMQTCGFYDEAGEFSYLVGLPGKSGVGGGIVAVHPLKYSVAVWSPRLNTKGNSIMGLKALELLTTYTAESIF